MSDESNLFRSIFPCFRVKIVSSSYKGILLPPISVHSVNRSRLLLAIDSHSLIETLLRIPHVAVYHAQVLVFSLHDFDRISIQLLHSAGSPVGVIHVVHEGPLSGLGPLDSTAEMVFVDAVFPSFKPETSHSLII